MANVWRLCGRRDCRRNRPSAKRAANLAGNLGGRANRVLGPTRWALLIRNPLHGRSKRVSHQDFEACLRRPHMGEDLRKVG